VASANLHWQVPWAKIEYLGITATPTFFPIFALNTLITGKALSAGSTRCGSCRWPACCCGRTKCTA
jgi:hypothetical protein